MVTEKFIGASPEITDNTLIVKKQIKYRTIFDVVKTGTLEAVQFLVSRYGLGILTERDENGQTVAHWACLGGFTDILGYMAQLGICLDAPGGGRLGTRPIHWACVRGHIAVVDLLLKSGVAVDSQDLKGSTPLIAASQHNHLRLVAYLLAAGAKWDLPDHNGDTALHWAAWKGHVELMRMLINTGLNPQQPDEFGHTPLHLACLGGHTASVQELCFKSDVSLQCLDHDGLTPLQLADFRKHSEVADFLRSELRVRARFLPTVNIRNFIFGPPGKSKGPLLFFLLSLFFWGYPMYLLRCVPLTWHSHPRLHATFLCANGAMWVGLMAAHTRDPGFLARDDPDYLAAVRRPDTPASLLARLCHSCRALRPIRAKHCRACGRCVLHFDHHCPYIYNCVGLRNRVWFLVFATMVAVNCSLTVVFAAVCIMVQGWQSLYIAGLLESIFFCGLGWLITGATLYNAAMNLTTNEVFNYKRYQYLKDDRGKFQNPFSRGILKNLVEFFLCSQNPRLQDDSCTKPDNLVV